MDKERRWVWGVTAALAVGVVGAGWIRGQDQPAAGTTKKDQMPAATTSKGKSSAKKTGGLRAGGGPAPKGRRPNPADPLTKRPPGGAPGDAFPQWPCHFKLRITGPDNVPLAAVYYPSQLGPNAPVILLVHEKGVGRSGKDFEDPITDLKEREGLAEHLQNEDYAVLVVDLRGHGGNPRKELTAREWQNMVVDLQAAYLFLVDRHNRREVNLAKLGVVALGDASNLVAAWAAAAGGAVASEGRISDLGAMVLVSPVEDAQGLRLGPLLTSLAPRLPILVLAGKKDHDSIAPVNEVKGVVERQQRSKVVLFDTSLHGYKLLRLFPKVVEPIDAFFKETIKIRLIDWEPRYLLTPVAISNIELVSKAAAAPATGEPAAKKKDAAAKKKDATAKKKEE